MRRASGMTLVEILIAAGLVLLLGAAAVLGVLDARRRARDTERLSAIRVAQVALEGYRHLRASYPADLAEVPDATLPEGAEYRATPEGCAAETETLCRGYAITFSLEGRVGTLSGGFCETGPETITCRKEL